MKLEQESSPERQRSEEKSVETERTIERIMDELYVAKTQLMHWQQEVYFLEIELFSALCMYERKGKYPKSMVGDVINYYCNTQKSG